MPDTHNDISQRNPTPQPPILAKWPIKTSLLNYVRANGTLSCAPAGLWEDSYFCFKPARVVNEVDSIQIQLEGEVFMRAHAGLLSALLQKPIFEWNWDSNTGNISFEIQNIGRSRFAEVYELRHDVTDQSTPITIFSTQLTLIATSLFGGYYAEDEPLDDFVLHGTHLVNQPRNRLK